MYIALGQGQTLPWGQTFDVNRKPLSLCPSVASLKILLWIPILYTIFSCFTIYIAPGRGRQSIGDKNADDNRKAFSLCQYVASFKIIWSKSDFLHIFNDFIHVDSPGARAENPLGPNFWCQKKALITSTICCKFRTNLFEFWFYTHFLIYFHMYIAPGQGQTTLCGQNRDVNRKALSLCPFIASFKKKIFAVWFCT